MKSKLISNKLERPLIIAGPCSAETEEQVLNTARLLKEEGVGIFRAGIWKPRTRPNCFEGIGRKALEWMKMVQQETGLQTATEVANGSHVLHALKYGIDIIWIGARTTANPFAIQEIADALEGVDIPILVKNPINPDVDLWIGALERLEKAGIKELGAIHRGFSSYEHSIYRNIPQWQIPIELKRRMPNIPMICDPSHICGNRELLQSVSQKAMDLNFDGLMIETHLNPNKAWSDSKQQITPQQLTQLLSNLELRVENPDGISFNTLEDLRFKIDQYDSELINILQKRMEVTNSIGQYKKDNNMTILQTDRWESILKKHLAESKHTKLSERFINKLFKAIHEESIAHQTKIMNIKK